MRAATSTKSQQPIAFDLILAEIRSLLSELQAPRPIRRLLTVPEAADYLGISPKTVRNMLSLRTFPVKPVRVAGRVLFRIEDLANYVDNLEK